MLSPAWMLLHEGGNISSADDYATWDDTAARQQALDCVGDSAGNEFPRMNDVIVKCPQEYKAQQTSASAVQLQKPPHLKVAQGRTGGFAAGVAADHAIALFPAALAFERVGGRAVLGHAPGHAHPPAVAAEKLPIGQTGALGVELEPSDLAPLVEEARNAFLNAEGRSILRIDLPPNLPRIMADRRRIVQVLGNLLSNAARHAPESPEIRVAGQRGAPTWRCQSPTRARESPTTVCLASSGSSPPAARGSRVVPDWAWPSAAGS